MKILYGIQATGNGHAARAKEIIPELKKHAEVDILLSGPGVGIDIGYPVKYIKEGIRLGYNKGNIDIFKSLKTVKLSKLLKDIYELDLSKYDLVISDFEPITAWAAKIQGKKSIGIARQYSFINQDLRKELPFNPLFDFIINFFALCDKTISLNYKSYGENMYTPIIRNEIKNTVVTEENHITVYIWDQKGWIMLRAFSSFKDITWHVFSKNVKKEKVKGNIILKKTDKYEFAKSLASSKGAILGSGFTATTECLYMGKKMMIIPQQGNLEQESNAIQLEKMGIKVFRKINRHFKKEIQDWFDNYYPVKVNYPEVLPKIVKDIINFAKDKTK
jgi:uncharacterized protein (TIGR00661 family)